MDDRWHIWVDTGGTFTDVLALPPGAAFGSDQLRRGKVLSSSALRGSFIEKVRTCEYRIDQRWGACDDFIKGFDCHPLNLFSANVRVLGFDSRQSIVRLDQDITAIERGLALEFKSTEPAAILGARLVTQTRVGVELPPALLRLATTRGTNALLERKGAPTALFITKGFGDLLHIGDQQRPDLFALEIRKLQPLQSCTLEVPERIDASGKVLKPVDLSSMSAHAAELLKRGIKSAAIALLNSYRNDSHERQLGDFLRQMGFEHVSVSSAISPLIRLLPRAQTTVVDAYLSPIVGEYLDEIGRHVPSTSRVHVMTSAGGLVKASEFRACDSLLSGPAGGVAGAAAAAALSGFIRIIGFDMGGTSTDVARFDSDFEYQFEQQIAGVRIMTPSIAIETVAAGGGSICDCVDGRLVVGPHSAGATPGPACYGGGGPLTVSDINLLLGRLDPTHFEIPLSAKAAEAAAATLMEKVPITGAGASREAILAGLLEIANERMAAAIEHISVRKGYDPKEYALVAFGGAGGQHACAVADRLGIRTIVLLRDASLLSAFGLGFAAVERFAQRQVLRPLTECESQLEEWIEELARSARQQLRDDVDSTDQIQVRRILAEVRLIGQDATLSIELTDRAEANFVEALRTRFAQRYRATYGHDPPRSGERDIEIESLRVVAATKQRVVKPGCDAPAESETQPIHARAFFGGKWGNVPLHQRERLHQGEVVKGPALICDRHTTCVIEPGWSAQLDAAGAIVALREVTSPTAPSTQAAIVQSELFANRIASIAQDMGHVLQRVALSTNIKERLDFSCAVLSSEGELIVNAPHIPVHLGALGMCVRAVQTVLPMEDGDVVVTNHPALGGSHLPDITVITPVFAQDSLIGYVANRAHHAEIGGTRPGSMPPQATTLAEEGVLIAPMYLARRGVLQMEAIEHLLRNGRFPSRAVADNLADLRAAVAANHRGADALRRLAMQASTDVVRRQMAAIANNANQLIVNALRRLPQGQRQATERLDDGSVVCVTITIAVDKVIVDFAGSSSTHPGNLNATPAIVHSAVMYVMRLLIGERLPLNEGIMRSVEVKIPSGMLNPEFVSDSGKCPAVVGGNTETSQRVVDTLIKAFGIAACSQGTMNNVLFGNDRFGYYETICGGSGAGPGFNGADAVHTHMTNTRITDPEIIEHRYPVRVDRFAIRRGSGGTGRWRGGDGVIREFTFLKPLSLSVLTQHRIETPFGMAGGGAGTAGTQRVIRASGETIQLQSIDGCDIKAGDRFVIETPGGGGWGELA